MRLLRAIVRPALGALVIATAVRSTDAQVLAAPGGPAAAAAANPFAFLVGSWEVSGTGEGGARSGRSIFTAVAGTIEEVRTEADREVMRALLRLEADNTWRYARADGPRQRMLVYAGPFSPSATLATATTIDGEARVILDRLSAGGFRLRLQELRGLAWATVWTETYSR